MDYSKARLVIAIKMLMVAVVLMSGISATAATLSGVIFGGASPLNDATVNIIDALTSNQINSTTSDSNGNYSFEVDDGTYNLQIVPPLNSGYNSADVNGVIINGSDKIQDVILISSEVNVLSGTISMPDETPVSGANVYIYDNATPYPTGSRLGESITDVNGQYSVELPPGTYLIYLRVIGTNISSTTGNYINTRMVTNIDLSSDAVQDITLPYVTVSGKTTDSDGVAIAGAQVQTVYDIMPNFGQYGGVTVTSDDSGDYSFQVAANNYDEVIITPPDDRPEYITTQYVNVDFATDTTRDFILKSPNTLSGTIIMPDETPVSGVDVSIYDNATPYPTGSVLAEAITDVNGQYSVELPPGTYIIHLRVIGTDISPTTGNYINTRMVTNIDLSSDAVQDITLPYVTVSGKTTDSDGVAIAGAQVQTVWEFAPNFGQYGGVTVTSDDSGDYSFQVAANNYDEVIITPPDNRPEYITTQYVNVDFATDTTRDFILKSPNTLSGTIIMPDQTTVSGVEVSIYDNATPYPTGSVLAEAITDVNGQYSVELPPGTYIIHLRVIGTNISPTTGNYINTRMVTNIDLSSDAVEDITLPYVTVSGKTTDSNGVAVAGTQVQAVWEFAPNFGQYGGAIVTSDTLGDYSFQVAANNYDEVIITPPVDSGFVSITITNYDLTQDKLLNIILPFTDTSAPLLISGPYITQITDTTSVVEWTTDEPATSVVQVVGGTTITDSSLTTHHSVPLSVLSASTAYTVTVSSVDGAGNNSATAQGTFTTLATPDNTAPVFIEGPNVSGITHNQFTLNFCADEPVTAVVNVSDVDTTLTELASCHQLVITNRSANTAYTVTVSITDAATNGPTISPTQTVTTLAEPDNEPPLILSGPIIIDISSTEATVLWATDEPATTGVSFNDGTAYGIVSDDSLTQEHSVQLTGLTAETTYYLTVSSKDIKDNGPTLSDVVSFTTLALPDTAAPVIIGSPLIQNITHKSVVIRWETDEPASSVVTMGITSNSLDRVESNSALKKHHNLAITGLTAETVYYFKVISTDAAGNNVVSELMSFQSKALGHQGVPHIHTGPDIEYLTDKKMTVSWITDVNADSRLVCSGGGSTLEVNKGKRSKKHQLTLTGLVESTAYSCNIFSTDIHGYTVSAGVGSTASAMSSYSTSKAPSQLKTSTANAINATITTSASADITAPIFSLGPIISGYGDLALVSWSVNEPASAKIQYRKLGDTNWLYEGSLSQDKTQALVLTELTSSIDYQLQVMVTDSSGNETQSPVISFNSSSRASLAAPSFTAQPTFTSIVDAQVIVSWATSGLSFGQVLIGKAADSLNDRESRISAGTNHSVSLVGLDADAVYYIQVLAYNIAGVKVLSEIKTFNITDGNANDLDNDGIPNDWETQYGLNPNDANDASLDGDEDGLTNLEEYQNNTNPTLSDTDEDGMSDGFEVLYSLDPLIDDSTTDSDNDGLTNLEEYNVGTNPTLKDTDRDGMDDSYEIDEGFDPLDGSDCPNWMCGSSKIWLYTLQQN